jgi:hypothetical protein
MFLETGNGSIGGGNFAMSVVKLNPSNVATVLDSFLPANAQSNSNADLDLNGGGMVLEEKQVIHCQRKLKGNQNRVHASLKSRA